MAYGTDPQLGAGVREGEVLAGKYRVERVLGAGGMGVVVAAHHVQLDERVALKFLLPEALGNAEAVARFAREARAAVKIKSEHVARVIDVGTLSNGAPYMVMEYLEGGDLAAWVQQRGPMPVEQAVEFVLQASVAVADAHALGIIHRDLKPANLFCVRRSDGQLTIKVLDFGISKMTDPVGISSGSATRTSALMGSPLYMSPEQMRSSKDVDARTDIWALGVILFQLLTGTTPFVGESIAELAVKVATEPPQVIRSFRPDVPRGLEAVILKCLERDRRNRYTNVAELAVALLEFGPKRAKASVERITGILQVTGVAESLSAPPPSPQPEAGTLLAPETVSPVGRTAPGVPGRRTLVVGAGLFGAIAVAALAGSAIWLNAREGPRAADIQPVSAVASPPATAVVPAPLANTNGGDAVLVPLPAALAPSIPLPIESREAGASVPAPAKKPFGSGGAPARPLAAPPTSKPVPAAPPVSPPCKLVKTLDQNGEAHFSCPCAVCL